MSRVSSKSSLSPSATRGSNRFDLGKDSGVDMGRKARPSVTMGGIGVTQEVANIGGMTVTGGVSVDISPINLDISGNVDYYDPNKNSVSIAGGAEIPGGILGVSGGVTINTSTGEIEGAVIGGEVAGIGIDVSNSKHGGVGVSVSVQIPFTPIEISLGFGFPPDEEPKTPTPTPTPTPDPTLSPNTPTPPINPNPKNLVLEQHCSTGKYLLADYTNFSYQVPGWKIIENVITAHRADWIRKANHYDGNIPSQVDWYERDERDASFFYAGSGDTGSPGYRPGKGLKGENTDYYCTFHTYETFYNLGYWVWQPTGSAALDRPRQPPNYPVVTLRKTARFIRYLYSWEIKNGLFQPFRPGCDYDIQLEIWSVKLPPNCPTGSILIPTPTPPPPPIVAPFPNPPPRKEKMDECCRDSVRLLRRIHKHLGVSPITGMEPLERLAGVTAKGETFQGDKMAFPFEVPKVWLDVQAKKNEKVTVRNLSELMLVMGAQSERLERVLGTKEFIKDSEGKLRQSEGNLLSWLSGKNPDFAYPDPNDFWLNTDDGIIKEKRLEVRSLTDAVRYTVEAINRLERILPIAELKDSSIPARWIYPKGKGQLRVGNLIHLCEYMIRKSDKDMGYWPQKITIKAADPEVKDDEAITTDVHSQADMLRVIMQQIINAQGDDGDMGSNYDLRRTYLDIMAFQMITKSTKYLQAITEYLGFDITEEVSKIPIPFDPFAGQDRSIIEEWWIKFGFGEAKTNFPDKVTESEIEELSDKLLQNSELEVSTISFGSVDAKKEPKTLKETLIEILKHSSASAAAVTEVATESALDRVVDAAGIAQKLASFLMRRDIREALGIGDLDNWISSAEKGYTDNLETESLRFPESNSLEPYGRPATQNPTIREIDTKDTKAD